jgi:hypothetical protein
VQSRDVEHARQVQGERGRVSGCTLEDTRCDHVAVFPFGPGKHLLGLGHQHVAVVCHRVVRLDQLAPRRCNLGHVLVLAQLGNVD